MQLQGYYSSLEKSSANRPIPGLGKIDWNEARCTRAPIRGEARLLRSIHPALPLITESTPASLNADPAVGSHASPRVPFSRIIRFRDEEKERRERRGVVHDLSQVLSEIIKLIINKPLA